MVDLHVHSHFSDGSETPEELARRGAEVGLHAMALTDHDSTRGVARFAAAAAALGIRTLSGVEISVEYPGGELHMLAYGIDPDHAELASALAELRGGRDARNRRMLAKLAGLGCPLDYAAVAALAGDDEVVGRPHIAMALVEAGYVTDKYAAFARYLTHGAPAYCDRLRLGPAHAMRLIRAAGGLPVLAHPRLLELDRRGLRRLIVALKREGLAGIEAYHAQQNADDTAAILALARETRLLVTGGSDYHGRFQSAVHLGVGTGALDVPDACFDALVLQQTAV